MIEVKNCPLCQKKVFKILYQKSLNVVECQNCGLIFTDPRWDAEDIRNHYNQAYYYSPDKSDNDLTRYKDYNARYLEGKEKQRFNYIFEHLSQFEHHKEKLLDVGAATGFMVKEALKRGWKAEGVEFSKWAANYAQKKNKVKVYCGELEQAKFPKNSFEVITMLDFLEHVDDPGKVLKEAYRILKPGGILYIETINFDHWITRYLIGGNYYYMVPEFHLFYFGRKQLRKFLSQTGFKIIIQSLWSSSVGDYEYRGFSMYWQYFKLLLKMKKGQNYAFKDVIKIFAQKI